MFTANFAAELYFVKNSLWFLSYTSVDMHRHSQ